MIKAINTLSLLFSMVAYIECCNVYLDVVLSFYENSRSV